MSLRTDVDGLATRFAACRIPHEEWTHQAHLAVGMWHAVASKDVLLRFYSREHLMSAHARAAWVEPDILTLPVADLLGSKVER